MRFISNLTWAFTIFFTLSLVYFVSFKPIPRNVQVIEDSIYAPNVYKYLKPNVFKLKYYENENYGGTGFLVKLNRPIIITNWHVCRDKKYIFLEYTEDKHLKVYPIYTDIKKDLCLIVLKPTQLYYRSGLLLSKSYSEGDFVYTGGFPYLTRFVVESGFLLGQLTVDIALPLNFEAKCENELKKVEGILETYCLSRFEVQDTTLIVYPGQSGSPVLNQNLEVVGVVSGSENSTNYGSIVPLEQLHEFINASYEYLND